MNKLVFLSVFFLSVCTLEAHSAELISCDGVSMYYETYGEGPPVLIINGGPGFTSEGFIPLAKQIAAGKFRTIIFDQRGTGRSELSYMDSTNISMQQMALDIECLRHHLGIEEWAVLGHSFGGMLAAYYTANYPTSVKGLIFSSSGGLDLHLLEDAGSNFLSRLSEEEADSLSFWRTRIAMGDTTSQAQRKRAQFMAPAYVFNKCYTEEIAERLTQGNMRLNRLVWEDLLRINYDVKDAISNFPEYTLVIQGRNDIIPEELAMTADSVLPNSKLVLLDSCGHYGWLDRETRYFFEVYQYLNSLTFVNKFRVQEQVYNYVKSIYDRKPELVSSFTDSNLSKSGFYYSRKGAYWSYHTMTYKELVSVANEYNRNKWIPDWAPYEVELIELKENVAIVKLKAIWGFDYCLMSKVSPNEWKISKVLWQSYEPDEGRILFSKAAAYASPDSTSVSPFVSGDIHSSYGGCYVDEGKEFYFFQRDENGFYSIFWIQKLDGRWGSPQALKLFEKPVSTLYPVVSGNGKHLVFCTYQDVGIEGYPTNSYIWISQRNQDGTWGVPGFMEKVNFRNAYHSNLSFSKDGSLIYRVTKQDGVNYTYRYNVELDTVQTAQLCAEIEYWKYRIKGHYLHGGVPGHDTSYIILDVSELDRDGNKLPSDLWISYRNGLEWTYPTPLRHGVNRADKWESFPFYSLANNRFFFTRDFKTVLEIPLQLLDKQFQQPRTP